MKQVIFMLCCVVLFVVPLIFVASKVYQDGVFGRIGLSGISFFAATFLLERFTGTDYEISGQMLALVASFTIFICWHLIRFHSRVVLARLASRGEVERRRLHDAAPHG